MAHNLHGDIPPEHLELAEELEELEEFFEAEGHGYESSLVAKSYVCCAHDWYDMGDDEKGSTLLAKAEAVCPGYFDNQMKNHIDEDELFGIVVEGITKNILSIVASLKGDKC